MSDALDDRRAPASAGMSGGAKRRADDSRPSATDHIPAEPPIATVDGAPIYRSRVVNLLLASHGVGILEQLAVLDAAERLAAEKGIHLSKDAIAAEKDRALRKLTDPLAAVSGDSFDREAAERVLDRVLSDRNVSHEEYDLVIRRNALLRAIALAGRTFSDEELGAEFDRIYGESVVVRLIQVATLAEATRVRRRLDEGERFEEVARTQSVNIASAQRGGLLDPFTRSDDRVPEALREAAFQLKPGTISSPVRVGEWHHILRVEERRPPDSGSYDARRDELERRLQDRWADSAMRAL